MTVVLVAGASSRVGREAVRILRARGLPTIAHVSPEAPDAPALRRRFEADGALVDDTPWDTSPLMARLPELRPSIVLCLVGVESPEAARVAERAAGRSGTRWDLTDYSLTRMLVAASSRASLRPRFVYLSGPDANESTRSDRGRARWKAEQAVRHSGLPWTIVRAPRVLGLGAEEASFGDRTATAALGVASTMLRVVGARALTVRWAPRTASDIAESVVDVALDPATANRVVDAWPAVRS